MRHVTRSWQATVLSGLAEYRGAKHTVVNRWLRMSAQKRSRSLGSQSISQTHVMLPLACHDNVAAVHQSAEWITEV